MSSKQNRILFFILAGLFSLAVPELSPAEITFLSTPSFQQSTYGVADVFENTRFRFSSDGPVSFHFSGETLKSPGMSLTDAPEGVLKSAYIRFRSRPLGTDFSLGRMYITTAGELMEGFSSQSHITGKMSLWFFSGRTVGSSSDLTGGRIMHRFSDRASVGISYISQSFGSDQFREKTAIELRIKPHSKLTLFGTSRMDLLTGNWTEHSYSARIGPVKKATLLLNASLLDPGMNDSDSDRSLTTSAGIQCPLSRTVTAGFTVRRRAGPFSETVSSREARISYSPLPGWNTAISLTRHKGENMGFLELNARAEKKTGDLEAFLNLRKTIHDNFSAGGENVFSTALGLAWQLSPAYRLVADLERTRDSHLNLRSFLKLEYRFGA